MASNGKHARSGSQFSNAMSSILHQTVNLSVHEPLFLHQRKNSGSNNNRRKFRFGAGSKDAISITVREYSHDHLHANKVRASVILLSEYLHSHQNLVTNQKVLELGAGCGLLSFLCCRLGATHVFASDSTKWPKVLQKSSSILL